MTDFITPDLEKCTKCGACVEVCPRRVLEMRENGPFYAGGSCCLCGHCVAVCPTEALENKNCPLENQVSLSDFTPPGASDAQKFLRMRRSVRAFLPEPVPREKMLELIEIARFAQTGSNSQGISYLLVDDEEVIQKAREYAGTFLEGSTFEEAYPHSFKHYTEIGVDYYLRGAPNLILALSDKGFENGRNNAIFSLTYVELYAPALGLGTCWAGYFEYVAFSKGNPMDELFSIPENKTIRGAMMVGYPKYHYPRLVDRNPLDYTFFT